MSEDQDQAPETAHKHHEQKIHVHDDHNEPTVAGDESEEQSENALPAPGEARSRSTAPSVRSFGLSRRRKTTKILTTAFVVAGLGTTAVVVLPKLHFDSVAVPSISEPIQTYHNATDGNSGSTASPEWQWLTAGNKLKNWDQLGSSLNVLMNLALVLGLGMFWYSRSTRRKYVQIDHLAMIVSDTPEPQLGRTKIIPWKCMQQVEIQYGTSASDDPAMAIEAATTNVIPAGAGSAPITISDKAIVNIYVDDGAVVKVRWKDIIASVEPGQFINSVKTWAPDACSDTTFPDTGSHLTKVDGGAYTQLWFKYYSAGSDRKRTTQLEARDLLQEGRFQIAGQIGGGGQGTAYLAVDNKATIPDQREIVLKEYILPVHRGQQVLEQTISKLEHEATILRTLNHPQIVRMLDSFVEDHRGYLVMEYVAGRQLKDIVNAEGPQPESAVLPLALQVCDILTYLHGQSPPVVHRDLTPDNLILQSDGQVKLVDFNVAHQLESAATATVVGKHCYIPPEQFRGRPTAQSDIYALGCTMHYLLTGEEPEPLTPSKPRNVRGSVSEELNSVVARSTSLDPNRRYLTAEEMKQDLLEVCHALKLKVPRNDSPFENTVQAHASS